MRHADITHATTVTVSTPTEAHRVVSDLYQKVLKPMTMLGREMQITVCQAEDDRSVRQNRYWWGVVLKEIAEQATISGQRYTPDAWHELAKRTFLGFEVQRVSVAGRRKKTVIRRLRSSAKLSIKQFNVLIEKMQAMATTELGVRFSSDWWE